MLIVLTSPGMLVSAASEQANVAAALTAIANAGHDVTVVSNNEKPPWFDTLFPSPTKVSFAEVPGRQNGTVVADVVTKLKMAHHDVLVLASSLEDMQMGKNSNSVLVAVDWSPEQKVRDLGISVPNAADLIETVRLTDRWSGKWWFTGDEPWYSVRALSDLSTLHRSPSQQEFGVRVRDTVKQGGPRLMALLTIGARSLLQEGLALPDKLAFGVYPSSSSANDDGEVLSDFTHRLRTTVSRVRFAQRGGPLFIRHTKSAKRSLGQATNRTDPAEQVETMHLNPVYRSKLSGRHVVVIDDCTTYGVSFGVAAAFLRKAGAAKVTGVALGKFGSPLRYYEIELNADPFGKVAPGKYNVKVNRQFNGTNNMSAQSTLVSLL